MNNKMSHGFYIFAALVAGCISGMSLFSVFVHEQKEMAEWLSGIGTISAVIVSLYLANRPSPPAKLSARAKVMVAGRQGEGLSDPIIYCELYLENSGQQAALIKDIDWYCEGIKSGKLPGESIAIKGGDGNLITINIRQVDTTKFGIDLSTRKISFPEEDGSFIENELDKLPWEIFNTENLDEIRGIIEKRCFFKVTLWNSENQIDAIWEK
ncbi:hypothetical protein ACX2QB_08145 [Weissella viridescens]